MMTFLAVFMLLFIPIGIAMLIAEGWIRWQDRRFLNACVRQGQISVGERDHDWWLGPDGHPVKLAKSNEPVSLEEYQ